MKESRALTAGSQAREWEISLRSTSSLSLISFLRRTKRLGLITVFDVSVTFFNHSSRSQDVSSLQFSDHGSGG